MDTTFTIHFPEMLKTAQKQAHKVLIMAYGSTPYVGMTPKKNGGHNKSAQMTEGSATARLGVRDFEMGENLFTQVGVRSRDV